MLETGDRAPQFLLDDVEGRPHSAVENRVAGNPVILLFSRDATDAFSAFAERIGAFKDRGATLFVISGANVALTGPGSRSLSGQSPGSARHRLRSLRSSPRDTSDPVVLRR